MSTTTTVKPPDNLKPLEFRNYTAQFYLPLKWGKKGKSSELFDRSCLAAM